MSTMDAHQRPQQDERFYEDYDSISIKELILTIWGFRRWIVILGFAATLLVVGVGAVLYLSQEKYPVTKLSFQLEFDSAEKGQYPNGTPFSSSDILVTPVLKEVYQTNGLEKYMSFSNFKGSLSVIQRNDELRLLEYRYAAKLEDRKLSVEQRERLEAEFREKKKSLMTANYELVFAGDESITPLPPTLRAKVLNDLLSTWAEYAQSVKGVTQYDIALVSRDILRPEDIETEDYPVVMDMLRSTLKRVLDDIDKVMKVPGASVFRLPESGLSLLDLRYRTLDIESYRLNPMLAIVGAAWASGNGRHTGEYLRHRITELKMKAQGADTRIKVYEKALRTYVQGGGIDAVGSEIAGALQAPPPGAGVQPFGSNVMPQIGESFLDNLISIVKANLDIEFRRSLTQKTIEVGLEKAMADSDLNYYAQILKNIEEAEKLGPGKLAADGARQEIRRSIAAIYDNLMQTISQIRAIYEGLSQANLNAASTLYGLTKPVYFTVEKALTTQRLIPYLVVAWVLLQGCILLGVLIASAFMKPGGKQPATL
ncbi:hypothetical protein [Desulfatiglans anilini]|uniref:hypothetical protein n=1 Tax=Desulfatiglans anilini TaxID=90728 RepID=UPI000413FB4C|nr:hypothetical protein [Desulfatiglans anilini]